ncbi:MAG: ATP-binding protein, partial [Pseudomonadota bacterium]
MAAIRHFSMRSLLGLSLLFLVLLPALFVGWWMLQRTYVVVDELAGKAMQASASRGQADVQNHLQQAYRALDGLMPENKTLAQSAQAVAWVSDPALFAPMAFALTRASNDLRFVYFSTALGGVHGVENAIDGFRFGGRGAVDNGSRMFSTRQANAPFKSANQEGESPDPRSRPWYDTALQARARVLSPAAIYPESKQLVVTLSQPVYDNNGVAVGVLGADLSLQPLSALLRAQRVSPHGAAYLVDDKGFLLASTDDDSMVVERGEQLLPRTPYNSTNPLIRNSFMLLEKQWSGAPDNKNTSLTKPLQLTVSEDPLLAMHSNVGSSMGLSWKLVVVAPESDFGKDAGAAVTQLWVGIVGLMLLGILITSISARHLEKMFRYLARAADALGNGSGPLPFVSHQRTPVRELSLLARSLHDTAQQLNENNFDALSEPVPASAPDAPEALKTPEVAEIKDAQSKTGPVLPVVASPASPEAEPQVAAPTRPEAVPEPEPISVPVLDLLLDLPSPPPAKPAEPSSPVLQSVSYVAETAPMALDFMPAMSAASQGAETPTSVYPHSGSLQAQLLNSTTALAAARDRALAATRSKAAFLAVISHELRTPLNGVLGMSSLLATTALSPEQRDYVQSLNVSSKQLQAVIDEVLEYSRTESGELVLEMAPFNVRSVVEEACDQVAKAAHAKGLKLVVDVPGRVQRPDDGVLVPWIIKGDGARLGQILGQMVANAVKFTDSGSVHVQVRPVGGSAQTGLPMLEARVLDTGPGIATDQLRKVFMAFTQLDSSISRKHGGIGLGLATCKRLVELMGGNIGVESEPGIGSTFWFTALAPWVEPEAAASPAMDEVQAAWQAARAAHAPRVSAEARKTSILVVDDNLINLKVACAMLLKFGYNILTAEGGQEAVSCVAATLARGDTLGAVLMDVHMPDVDGIQATQAIRAAHGALSPPIIALTAGASNEDRKRCFDAGMVDYLTKPLQVSALARALDKWIPPDARQGTRHADSHPEKPEKQDKPDKAEKTEKLFREATPAASADSEVPKFERFSDADISMPTGLVDFDRLNDFKEFDDAELTMTREVISLLFSEVPVQLAAIERAIANADIARLSAAAHSLRGAASNVGAVTVQHLCSVLER